MSCLILLDGTVFASYTVPAFAFALLQGVVNDVNIPLKVQHAKEFVHHKLRSDCPLFACFSSPFTGMILYFAGRNKYGWLTKLQALLSNQTRFVCLGDDVGQLP